MPTLRVLFIPRSHAVKSGLAVLGGTLALAKLGKGPSAISTTAGRKPALLRLHAAYLPSIRTSTPEFLPFASLRGEIERRPDAAPRFILPPAARLEYTARAPQEPPPTFELRLELDGASFDNVPDAEASIHQLRLPARPPEATHLEIGLELEVDGSPEAPREANDVLDVPLSPLSFFEALLFDAEGKPLPDQPFRLELADGSMVEGESDENGLVRVMPVMRGECVLHLGSAPTSQES